MITGELTAYLEALGASWDAPAVRELAGLLGAASVSEATEAGVTVRRIRFTDPGVVMEFRSERLTEVTFTVAVGANPVVDALIDGLSSRSGRTEMRAVLGEPMRAWFAIDEYPIDGHLLRATFHGGGEQLARLELLAEDPVVLRYDLPWSPHAWRRDGRLFLQVPVSLGPADTTWDFEITADHVAALRDRAIFDRLRSRLDGRTDRTVVAALIDEVCLG